MTGRIRDHLTTELFAYLQHQHPFVVITIDDQGWPSADMLSWILALDQRTIRMAIGSRRRSMVNIRANPLISLQIMGPGLAYEIKGRAQVIKERCASVKFPQTMVEMEVISLRENMYPANFITGDLPVGWPETTNQHHDLWNAAMANELRTTIKESVVVSSPTPRAKPGNG